MTGILSILPVEWLAGAAVVALGLVATWFGGRKAGKSAVKLENLKRDAKAHERMNHAPDLRTASDADRVDWLHRYADRNRVD